ncbi:MAG TPA: hypothetical protein VN577_18295 [Terriglobales bacterium]|nr:hypothetical protein [Terriglobales bacterium]
MELDEQTKCADLLTMCAGRVYWLAMALMDNKEVAERLTQQWFDVLVNFNRTFDVWLARWACKMAIKACADKKRSELVADRRNANVWINAIHVLKLDKRDSLHDLSLECVQRSVRLLPVLPRFMFVMHVLERYPVQEAASMLKLDSDTCDAALAYALVAMTKHIESSEGTSWSKSHSAA